MPPRTKPLSGSGNVSGGAIGGVDPVDKLEGGSEALAVGAEAAELEDIARDAGASMDETSGGEAAKKQRKMTTELTRTRTKNTT